MLFTAGLLLVDQDGSIIIDKKDTCTGPARYKKITVDAYLYINNATGDVIFRADALKIGEDKCKLFVKDDRICVDKYAAESH